MWKKDFVAFLIAKDSWNGPYLTKRSTIYRLKDGKNKSDTICAKGVKILLFNLACYDLLMTSDSAYKWLLFVATIFRIVSSKISQISSSCISIPYFFSTLLFVLCGTSLLIHETE